MKFRNFARLHSEKHLPLRPSVLVGTLTTGTSLQESESRNLFPLSHHLNVVNSQEDTISLRRETAWTVVASCTVLVI